MRTIIFISLLFVANVSFAQVAFDAGSESHTGTTGSISEASFSWTHTPVGTPAGVLVFTFARMSTTALATAVTYGGVAMSPVTGGRAVDTSGEPGSCDAWFLSSPPSGAQTVLVTRTNSAPQKYAVAITVTSGDATAYTDVQLEQENQELTAQFVDDGSPGVNSVRFAGVYSGLLFPPGIAAGSTLVEDIAFASGSQSIRVVYETTAGQGSRPVGFSASSDDVAAVYLAIIESASAPPPSTKIIIIQ